MSDNENTINKAKSESNDTREEKDSTSVTTESKIEHVQAREINICDTSNKDDTDAKNQYEESYECTICYLPLVENTDKVVLEECGHIFHSKCIRLWMKQKRTCPFCAGFSLLPEEYPRLI